MDLLAWLLHTLLALGSPQFTLRIDHREADGFRYWVACALEYQRPETMMCLEVPR